MSVDVLVVSCLRSLMITSIAPLTREVDCMGRFLTNKIYMHYQLEWISKNGITLSLTVLRKSRTWLINSGSTQHNYVSDIYGIILYIFSEVNLFFIENTFSFLSLQYAARRKRRTCSKMTKKYPIKPLLHQLSP